MLSEGPVVWI